MIGWSRRSTESRRRRAQWWASLTPEQKALEIRREAVADRWFLYVMVVVVFYLVVLWAAFPHEWFETHRLVSVGLLLLGHPGGLIVGAFVAVYKKRRVK